VEDLCKSILITEDDLELYLDGLAELRSDNNALLERWRLRTMAKGDPGLVEIAQKRLEHYQAREKSIADAARDLQQQFGRAEAEPLPLSEDPAREDFFEEKVWTLDCQGKKDYDGDLVTYSSRSYPRGGSSDIFGPNGYHSDRTDPSRQHIKPSAVSGIYVMGVEITKKWFEAETEEEVHAQAEAWVQEQTERVRSAVLRAFNRGT